MPIQDQMPRQEDDLLTRVAALEKQLNTVTGIAATAASIKQTLVSPLVGSASASGFVLTGSYADYAAFTLAIPSGFTRCLLSVSGFMNASSNSSTGEQMFSRIVVNGTAGPESAGVFYVNMKSVTLSAFDVVSLTGLAGGSISISIQGHWTVGPGANVFSSYNTAVVIASAMFLS